MWTPSHLIVPARLQQLKRVELSVTRPSYSDLGLTRPHRQDHHY